MKTKIITICLLLFFATNGLAREINAPGDSLLYNIQKKINDVFLNSFQAQNASKLHAIENKLRSIKGESRLVKYWLAYALCYNSIYDIKMNNKKESIKKMNQGIDILKNIRQKSSEDYALLAMMQGYIVRFAGGMKAAELGAKASQNAQKAVDLNNKNVRAWYVRGLNNYYTPEKFGGKKLVEKSMKKAISLKEKNRNNPYRPTWGKAKSYGLLVSYYIDKKDFLKAKKTLTAGLKKYPNDYMLQQDKKKLENK